MGQRLTLIGPLLVVMLSGCVAALPEPIAQPTPPPFPIPIVELSGTGQNIGHQHGQQLGEMIRSIHQEYFDAYFTNQTQRMLAVGAAHLFEPHISAHHREEIAALATACGLEYGQALLGQCFLDLSPMTACSAVALPASAAPDGVLRMGRNLDFPSFDIADKYAVVQIYRPAGKYQFASVSWPGLIGVFSGMNEHGLCLGNMEITRGSRLPVAMPYPLLYRTILEECTSVADAIRLLESTPKQTSNNLMLMDASGDRAVIEITPTGISVRRAASDAALISTNHQRGADASTSGKCPRYDLLFDRSGRLFGSVSRPTLQKMLADASQGSMTLQSIIFEPTSRIIWISTGADAAHKPMHRLELNGYFHSSR